MNSRRFWLLSIPTVVIGGLLLVMLFNTLKREGLFRKPQGPPSALTTFANYSPVEIDGTVYFPTVTATGLHYELAAHMQSPTDTPVLLAASGSAPLPSDYMQRLNASFGKIAYSPDDFHDYDTHYLIISKTDEGSAVCGVIIRHNEQFYLGNLDCELDDLLLSDLVAALSSLGET